MGNYKINVSGMEIEETDDHSIHIYGSTSCEQTIHSIVALDSPKRFGDYWSRPYRAAVKESGDFSLKFNHPFDAPKGSLPIYFSLEDGRNSGSGMKEVLQGGSGTSFGSFSISSIR